MYNTRLWENEESIFQDPDTGKNVSLRHKRSRPSGLESGLDGGEMKF